MGNKKTVKKRPEKKEEGLFSLLKENLFYLCLLAFVFVSSGTLALSKNVPIPFTSEEASAKAEKEIVGQSFAPIPVFQGPSPFFPLISAQAALAVDLDSSVSLYEKDPDTPFLPASTTKILTALVAMDYFPERMVLEVESMRVDGQKMGLVWGEEISVGSLLEGLLISSANDAAEILARNYPGGREVFISAMNQKAADLHMENSSFKNPTGFDGGGHLATARDLIRVSSVAMSNPRFAEIVGQEKKTVSSFDGRIVHRLVNTNKLLGGVEGVVGVKTGWTVNARENLVTNINRDGKRIMIAVMGSQDRFGETEELIEWIFENYQWEKVELSYSP